MFGSPTKYLLSSSRRTVEPLGFNPREYVTSLYNEREVLIWREIFVTLDTDEDSRLAPRDLLEAMSRYNGYHPKRNHIYHMIAQFDKD
jgi:Ca2+-binding EF-hand superfamily protein